MNILNPPRNYIDYRCATHRKEGGNLEEARKKFYKSFNCEGEIEQCFHSLQTQRSERTLPFESIEVRDSDGKKHGKIVKMMIYDIEYLREDGAIKQRKIYMANQGEI